MLVLNKTEISKLILLCKLKYCFIKPSSWFMCSVYVIQERSNNTMPFELFLLEVDAGTVGDRILKPS